MDEMTGRRGGVLRGEVAWTAITGAPVATWWLAVVAWEQAGAFAASPAVVGGWWSPADALVPLIAVMGAAVAAYLSLTAWVAVATGAMRGGVLPEWTTRAMPGAWRHVVSIAVGAVVSVGGAGAAAAQTVDDVSVAPAPVTQQTESATAVVTPVGWLDHQSTPSPVTSHAAVAPSPTGHSPVAIEPPAASADSEPVHASAPRAVDDATYEVRRGDSLWAIAARALGPGATDAEVSEAWRQIYRENRTTIGADPGLIFPGQLLTLPAAVAA